jgi:hypothetical protein
MQFFKDSARILAHGIYWSMIWQKSKSFSSQTSFSRTFIVERFLSTFFIRTYFVILRDSSDFSSKFRSEFSSEGCWESLPIYQTSLNPEKNAIRGQFHQHFAQSFYACRSYKPKNTVKLS